MAKHRHRIFEIYEFREEAVDALRPRADCSAPSGAVPQAWKLHQLAASYSASVTHLRFKKPRTSGENAAGELREDLTQLAESLSKNSRVLLDFSDVTSFEPAALDALVLFNKKLRTRGSRMVLCGLGPAAREDVFAVGSSASSISAGSY